MRTHNIYYLVFGLYSASWSWSTPVYTVFLQSRGLDLFEINLVFATYLIIAFLFEVPTGAVADVLGRRVSFLLSCGVRAVAFGMYYFADSFWDCLAAELVDAIGTTLATGALDAWAVDRMREMGDERPMGPVFARAGLLASPLMIVGGLLGAYAGSVRIDLPWIGGMSTFVVTGLVATLLMREPQRQTRHNSGMWSAWLNTTRDGFTTVRRTPVLLRLCVVTAATAFAVMPAWHYWPLRLQELSGEGVWMLGWVWALITVAAMAGNALMPWLGARYRREHILGVAWVWRGIMLGIGAATDHLLLAVGAVLAMQMVWGLSEPALQGWMNEHVGSDVRATVLSVRSMAFTLGGSAGLVCLGLVARGYGIATVWAVAALIVVCVAPLCWRLESRR